MTLWLTRDADAETGTLSDTVDVWGVRPVGFDVELGRVWLDDTNQLERRLACWPLADVRAEFGTYPDDSKQVIRAERP